MIKVLLYGDLGNKFGAEKSFKISSIKELFQALNVNYPKLRRYLSVQQKRGVFYQIFVDDKQLSSILDFQMRFGTTSVVKVIPVPLGAFGGMGSSATTNSAFALGLGTLFVVAGALLMFNPFTAPIGVALIFGGATLIAMGVIGLLSPQPQFKPEEDRKSSYLFDGMIGTSKQGYPVPLVYGRMLVDGMTINSSIRTSDSSGA